MKVYDPIKTELPAPPIFIQNIFCELYGVTLNLVVSNSVYNGLKGAGVLDDRTEDDLHCVAMFGVSRSNNWVLCFHDEKITAGVIAHECLHATFRILESKGIYKSQHNTSDEEVHCYLLDWLIDQVTDKLGCIYDPATNKYRL